MMQHQSVSSSRIRSIGYDKKQKILEIEFFGIGVYQYVDVHLVTYKTFLSATSKDRFFDSVIEGNFLCRKMG